MTTFYCFYTTAELLRFCSRKSNGCCEDNLNMGDGERNFGPLIFYSFVGEILDTHFFPKVYSIYSRVGRNFSTRRRNVMTNVCFKKKKFLWRKKRTHFFSSHPSISLKSTGILTFLIRNSSCGPPYVSQRYLYSMCSIVYSGKWQLFLKKRKILIAVHQKSTKCAIDHRQNWNFLGTKKMCIKKKWWNNAAINFSVTAKRGRIFKSPMLFFLQPLPSWWFFVVSRNSNWH